MTISLVDILPKIFDALLHSWLDTKDVVFLDSALCNREMRVLFLGVLPRLILFLPFNNSSICGYFEWLTLREIPIKVIVAQNLDPKHGRFPMLDSCSSGEASSTFITWLCKLLSGCPDHLKLLSIMSGGPHNALTTEVIRMISNCKDLQYLRLQHIIDPSTPSSPPVLMPIMKNCKKLRNLILSGCVFTARDALHIARTLVVFEYNATATPYLTAPALIHLVMRCRGLQLLRVNDSSIRDTVEEIPQLFNASMFQRMVEHLPYLQELGADSRTTDCTNLDLLLACPKLQRLFISYCDTLTVDTFTALILHPNMKELGLSRNRFLSSALQDDGAVNASLQHLSLKYFEALTDSGLGNLLTCCPALVTLTVVQEPLLLTARTVDAIVQHCPHMQTVTLSIPHPEMKDAMEARLRELNSLIKLVAYAPETVQLSC